ncbi:hypothetical protein LOK49_LG04G01817 [Camellia lanceoleosa]|uniref:Uncharacterized protein n=1 Tax=Camellia lanceoleosa TaxID=1840588 RepID=A0ACC0I490_9ERIC|nr:hypothetical protein LOK49_LG04G01817 [Camellia lanceoleosa]
MDAGDLRRRTVKRFVEDLGSVDRNAIDDAIRHVVQVVKLLAKKEDREGLDSSINELLLLGMQREPGGVAKGSTRSCQRRGTRRGFAIGEVVLADGFEGLEFEGKVHDTKLLHSLEVLFDPLFSALFVPRNLMGFLDLVSAIFVDLVVARVCRGFYVVSLSI